MVGVISAAKYAFPCGLVSAMPHTMSEEMYTSLINAGGVEEAIAVLEQSSYGKEVIEAAKLKIDLDAIERSVIQKYVNICKDVIFALPESDRAAVKSMLVEEWDILNLKRILRGINNKRKVEENIQKLGPTGTIDMDKMRDLAGSDMKQAVDKIKAMGYHVKSDDIFNAELDLDRELMSRWLNESERHPSLGNVVREQIDMLNLKVILRMKITGRDPTRFISETRYGKYLVKGILSEIAGSGFESIPDILNRTPYHGVFDEAFADYKKVGSIEKLELMIEKAISGYMMQQLPLTLEFVVNYLKRMRLDARNMRTILIGKIYGLSAEQIKAMLII